MDFPEIFFISPYCEGDIGKGINRSISLLPDNAWVCLMDSDTLFLQPTSQRLILNIIKDNSDYDLIGCVTNRLGSPYQRYGGVLSEEVDITKHQFWAKEQAEVYGTYVEETPKNEVIAGCLMLFKKSVWDEVKFEERSIQFDIIFNKELRKRNKKIGLAKGLYVFHLYRLGMKHPESAIGHLIHCHDMNKTISIGEENEQGN